MTAGPSIFTHLYAETTRRVNVARVAGRVSPQVGDRFAKSLALGGQAAKRAREAPLPLGAEAEDDDADVFAYSYDVRGNPPRTLAGRGWGRFSISGTRITLRGGPWASFYGTIKTLRKIVITLKGERYSYATCTLKRRF